MDKVNISVDITSNKKEYQKALEECAETILTAIGLDAASAAQDLAPYDTGLLRNSITFALAGKGANISSYQAENPGENGETASGEYSGTSPADQKGEHSVHIGTNVEYAMAQEVGSFNDGPHAFLRPAINNNIDHFREIMENELKKAMDGD